MVKAIYKLIHRPTGKFYIGRSQDVTKRFNTHLRDMELGKHHSVKVQATHTCKVDWFIEIVETGEDTDLKAKEQFWLDKYGVQNLLNVSAHADCGDLISNHPDKHDIISKRTKTQKATLHQLGETARRAKYGRKGSNNGMYGKTHSHETKEALKMQMRGNSHAEGSTRSEEVRLKLSDAAAKRIGELNPFFGKKHSKETRRKLSEANKGKTPPNRKKLRVGDNVYGSATEAAKDLNVCVATITYRVNSKTKKNETYKYED